MYALRGLKGVFYADVLSNHHSDSPGTRKSRTRKASPPCAFADVLPNYSSYSPDTRKSRTRIFLIFVFPLHRPKNTAHHTASSSSGIPRSLSPFSGPAVRFVRQNAVWTRRRSLLSYTPARPSANTYVRLRLLVRRLCLLICHEIGETRGETYPFSRDERVPRVRTLPVPVRADFVFTRNECDTKQLQFNRPLVLKEGCFYRGVYGP